MKIQTIVGSVASQKALGYLQLATTTASICIALMCMGVFYVNTLGYWSN